MRDLKTVCWPHVPFYDKQWEIVDSVEHNVETHVVAGNKLGKDFIAGFIALASFIVHPVCRIITTSVKEEHLDVLWAELRRFIDMSLYPLDVKDGGPLLIYPEKKLIRKRSNIKRKENCRISYLRGLVASKNEGFAGHHAPYTLVIADEASSLDDENYIQFQGWANRMLFIGNPMPCNNVFYRGVKGGDLEAHSNLGA